MRFFLQLLLYFSTRNFPKTDMYPQTTFFDPGFAPMSIVVIFEVFRKLKLGRKENGRTIF